MGPSDTVRMWVLITPDGLAEVTAGTPRLSPQTPRTLTARLGPSGWRLKEFSLGSLSSTYPQRKGCKDTNVLIFQMNLEGIHCWPSLSTHSVCKQIFSSSYLNMWRWPRITRHLNKVSNMKERGQSKWSESFTTYLTPHTEINLRWKVDINAKGTTIKLPEENIGKYCHDLEVGKDK